MSDSKIFKFLEYCGKHQSLSWIALSAYCIMYWNEKINNKIRGIK